MPNKHEVKSEVDRNTSADHPPDIDGDDDDSEFVEVDPTGRYGRYDDVLGKGAFKTVYRAFDEVDGIEVAWNQVKVQDVLKSPDDLERLYSEVHLLKTLKHKNIIKFYNSWVDTKTKNVNFITEIFTSGTLRQYRKKHKHVDIKAVKNWSRQILRGLLYLHSHDPPIIHRDLKCDNIFVNGNQGEVKIGDLGLAAILRQAHAAHSVIGTPEFMAPELYEEEYNELVDIYSFGMCLLEMVTFEYPYSECTNAAQIYKKVTSGKKPAALEKVKDPEVRAFVEKCLAAASIRLPARELLMDSFLQCEGDREALECGSSLLIAKCRIDDMEELGVVFENPVPSMPQLADFHTKQKGLGDHSDSQADVVITSEKPPPSSVAWEPEAEDHPQPRNSHFESDKYSGEKERARRSSRDFRVKGKRGDDDTIYLRLRIADHDGHSRNIHFPFDIEMDTAMSVASEMVAELDLSDQDVTTIAEMIDVEILALVPEWTPGVAVDDTGATDGETGGPNEDSYPQEPDESEPIATISSEDSMTEQLASSWKPRSFSPKISSIAGTSPPRVVEGTMHGRFEEVTYRTRSDLQQRGPEDPVVFSSDSSEGHIRGEEDWEHDRSKSEASVADSASPTRGSFSSGLKHTDLAEEDCHSEAGSFDELGEARSTSSAQYTGRLQEEGGVEDNQGFYRSNDHIENGGLLSDWSNHSEDEEATTNRELERLTLQQKEELRDLQHRHEQALLAIKNRMWQKPSKSISSRSQHTHSSNEDFRRSNIRNQTFRSTQPRSASCVDLRSKQFLETRNGKLPSEESEVLSRLASRKGAGMSSGYVNFMDEPRGFGLDHNLQGHFSQESSSDSRYNRRHSWKPDTATREHGKFKEHYFY